MNRGDLLRVPRLPRVAPAQIGDALHARRFAARMPAVESSTTTQSFGSVSQKAAAFRNMSGSGLPFSTSSRVKTLSGWKISSMSAFSKQTPTRARGEPEATTCCLPAACNVRTVAPFKASSLSLNRS